MLVRGIDEGLRDCSCSWVDVDALEYLAMRLLNFDDIDHFVFPIPWDSKGHLVIPTDPALTVEQWVQKLDATRQRTKATASASAAAP